MLNLNALKITTLALTLISGVGAQAATTGQINLSGSVNVTYDISVSQAAAATDLDIVNGESGTNVATVTEITNNPSGYKVTIQSQNRGLLIHDTVASSTVDYDISYNGVSIDPDGTVQKARTEASSAVSPGNSSAVTITFTGLDTDALAGTYSDTLDLEIGAP